MTAHKMRILLVAAVVAVILALWATRVQQPTTDSAAADAPLLPGLLDRLDRVSALSLSGGEDAALDITLTDGRWGVAQRHGYPVDMGKLRETLMKLAEARLVEPKTANPANYPQLGVEDPGEPGAGGTLLSLGGPDGESRVIIGRYNGQGSGTFVRYPDDSQSWLTGADLTLDRDPTRWLARDIVDLPASQVKSLELVHGDGASIRAYKDDEEASHFTVADLPPGRELTSEFVANGLAGLLASLRLEDVLPAEGQEVPDSAINLIYDTFDGRRYAMRVWDADGEYLLSLSAEMSERPDAVPDAGEEGAAADDGPAVPAPSDDETAGGNDGDGVRAAAEAEAARAHRLAADAVADLNARSEGWVFRIAAFKWSAINKRMEDLLKPRED